MSVWQTSNQRATLVLGDSVEVLPHYPDGIFDALVTDPPAGIGFMGKGWDSDKGGRDAWIAWLAGVMKEAMRLLKPGAHGLVWALPRTSHWTATALEDAGFEIRDRVSHLFGTGFPKSANVSKMLDKAAGAVREVTGPNKWEGTNGAENGVCYGGASRPLATAPSTDAAKQWDGWGTALKPACEDWWLVRKPLDGTVAANILAHGCGGLNIDGCRISGTKPKRTAIDSDARNTPILHTRSATPSGMTSEGRWPANVTLDEEAAAALDEMSGEKKAGVAVQRNGGGQRTYAGTDNNLVRPDATYGDFGGASRFFYVAKPARSERDRGCSRLEKTTNGAKNIHPTVKNVVLMRWLCRLITPPNGIILDPFMGSGSTGIAALEEWFQFFGIEREEEYFEISKARIVAARFHQKVLL